MKHCLIFTLAVLFLAACGGRQFTEGQYDDLAEERHLDDKFNETDMQRIAQTIINSLAGSPVVAERKKPPVVLVTMVKNRTQEHIDMTSMTNKIRTALIKSGKFRFTDEDVRERVESEVSRQNESAFVDPETARKKGKQVGADFFLTGEITDRVQEVGNKKYVYYKATFNLVNLQTGLLDFTEEAQVRKYYTKKSVGF